MTDIELKSCIGTIEMLRRLAYNIHGVMDVIDADNCEKIIKVLSDIPKYKDAYNKGWDDGAKASYEHLKMCEEEQGGNLISRDVVLDTIHRFFTEEVDKIPTKKTEDGEVYVIHKCQPLFEMNKAICKRIKALPSVSPTQNCVGNALDMRCDDLISRQVLDEIKELMTDVNGDTVYAVKMSDIRQLPPINPQEPCEDWYDLPADEMTFKQARQAVKDLRIMLAGYLTQEPKWIPVSERLPELNKPLLVTAYHRVCYAHMISESGNYGYPVFRLHEIKDSDRVWVQETISHGPYSKGRIGAWMYIDIPEPYKVEPQERSDKE